MTPTACSPQEIRNVYENSIIHYSTQTINLTFFTLIYFPQNEIIKNYKDRKCTVNENPSVRIESAGSNTCDNRPLKNVLFRIA